VSPAEPSERRRREPLVEEHPIALDMRMGGGTTHEE
jgi:hypothetical protein